MFLNTDSKYIWLNGSFQPFNDSNIHLLSHTLHYGLGAFEGIRAYETENGGAIFRLREHTERLFDKNRDPIFFLVFVFFSVGGGSLPPSACILLHTPA